MKIAKLLLDAGCDPTCKTKEGRTALMMAIEQVGRTGSFGYTHRKDNIGQLL